MFRRIFNTFRKENYTNTIISPTARNAKVLCIYAVYNIDDDDMKFINENCDNCDFVVIDTLITPYLNSMHLRSMDAEKRLIYIQRPNIGYDVTSWKRYTLENYEKLKSYDYVVYANNSCRYDFYIRNLLDDMIKKEATFYGINWVNIRTEHIQSYFIIVANSIIKNPGFRNHWVFMGDINGREDAITKHELTFMSDMKKIGAKIGSLTDQATIGSGYEVERYNDDLVLVPPFMKKKVIHEGANRTRYEKLISHKKHMV